MVKKHWILWLSFFLLFLLLAKNPFSSRTLIPNLEPYPDTIHYLSPAWNTVAGNGFQLFHNGQGIRSWVPPMYSLIMLPAFFIKNDVRMFYFVNVALSILSFFLFYLIIRKITKNTILLGVTLFLYVTNYFIYWYPSLAMGENLILTLFMAGFWLFSLPVTPLTLILTPIAALSIYLTKSANIPISLCIGLGYFIKIITKKKSKNKSTNIKIFVITCVILLVLITAFADKLNGVNFVSSLVFFLGNIFPKQEAAHLVKTQVAQQPTGWFSLGYMKAYLPIYIQSLFGNQPIRFLWENTPIVPFIVGTPGIIGLFAALFNNKNRLLSLALLSATFSSILFMSTFYAQDMRYLYHLIPTLLIGFVLFWEISITVMLNLFQHLKKKKILKQVQDDKKNKRFILYISYFLLVTLFLFYFATSAIRLKKQIMLNLKYAETPWYYLSVIKLNEYFNTTKNKPYIITAMTPYYVDFFSNYKYSLLPISPSQDFFRMGASSVWGKGDYSDLGRMYAGKINQGKEVYLLNYLGNDENIGKDIDKIKQNFNLVLVSEGCYGSCNIWRVNLK